MDGITTRGEAERRTPVPAGTGGVAAVGPDPAIVDPAEHNVVFTSLVNGDDDIVGLVAYSIYKQNKYDWLQAYGRQEGRMPDPAEVHSYLLGESTARRLATYRQLAQAVLDGRAGEGRPAVPGGAAPAGARNPPPRIGFARERSNFQLSSRAIVALSIALVVLVALFWLLRSGAPLPPQGK